MGGGGHPRTGCPWSFNLSDSSTPEPPAIVSGCSVFYPSTGSCWFLFMGLSPVSCKFSVIHLSLQFWGQQFSLWPHFSDLSRKSCWFFSLFSLLLVVRTDWWLPNLLYAGWENFPSIFSLLKSILIINGCWILSNASCCNYWDECVIFNLYSINMLYYMDWFFFKPTLYFWDKFHLILMPYLFYIFLGWFANLPKGLLHPSSWQLLAYSRDQLFL